jgi:hypothetical protein
MEHLGEVGARGADPLGHVLDHDGFAARVVEAAESEDGVAGGLRKWVQGGIPEKRRRVHLT